MEFEEVVKDILENEEFKKLKNIKQHESSTRYDHSYKVAKMAYDISKKRGLDYISITRAALLHDFHDTDFDNELERFISVFTHSKKALNNSNRAYVLNDIQRNIIRSHMYPFTLVMPKYKESVLVSWIDKRVSFRETLEIFLKA